MLIFSGVYVRILQRAFQEKDQRWSHDGVHIKKCQVVYQYQRVISQ